jgi:hypothetical protein
LNKTSLSLRKQYHQKRHPNPWRKRLQNRAEEDQGAVVADARTKVLLLREFRKHLLPRQQSSRKVRKQQKLSQ